MKHNQELREKLAFLEGEARKVRQELKKLGATYRLMPKKFMELNGTELFVLPIEDKEGRAYCELDIFSIRKSLLSGISYHVSYLQFKEFGFVEAIAYLNEDLSINDIRTHPLAITKLKNGVILGNLLELISSPEELIKTEEIINDK